MCYKRRILRKEKDMVKVGDKLYIESECYIGHGEDDIAGGLATISEIHEDCGMTMVCFAEVGSYARYNLNYIIQHQKEWAEEYAGQTAHPDPDYTDYGERW